MNRWIGKVLVVILVLLCILPVATVAAEYQIGDTLWTTGAEPIADTEQYSRWIPVIRSDGVQEYREVGKTGTYEYQWIVEEYYGPGKKEGIPTSFAVKNVDNFGDPMVGTEFVLFEERGDNLLLIASAVTNKNGVANLENLCLDDNSDTAVWHLVQTNFPENKMAQTHHPYTGMWDVYVTRDASGRHTLEMVASPAAQTMTLRMDDEIEDDQQTVDYIEESGQEPVEEHYDEQENVLTVVNEEITGRLSLYVEFEDGVAPEGIEAFSVDVTFPDGSVQTIIISKQRPQIRLINIPLGQYFINEQTDDIQAEGYTLKTKYTVARVSEDPVESQTVNLTEEKTAATVTITNCYEEISIANTILAKVMDEDGNLLDGAEVQLLDGNDNLIRTVSATSEKGTFKFDDLAEYAVKGETVTFKIRQSKAPAGYVMSEDQFIITVEKNNGKVTVSAKRDTNFLGRLFRSGEETGPNGESVIKFINKADLGSLAIKIVNTGVTCPVTEIPITVKGLNYQTQATLSEDNDWQVVLEDLPKSEYTILQDADAKGYVLVDKYTVSGGFMTGNQVELASDNTKVTITNTYSLESGKLHVQMAFAEDVIPAAVTKIPVTVTGKTAYTEEDIQKNVNLTAANGWKATLDLLLGEYEVTQDVSSAQTEGYEFIPDAEQKTVTLKTANEEQTCTITNQYTQIQEPLLEKLTIQVNNQTGDPIQGCSVGLFIGEDKLPKDFPATDANGQIIIDDLKAAMDLVSSMLGDGERQELTLKQIEVPEEYEISAKNYEIYVEKKGEELTYGITGVDTSGTEITLTFTNSEAVSEDPGIPGKVVVQMKNQNGDPIQGGTIGLYMDGDKLPKSFPATDANGQIVIDDLQGLLDRYGSMLPEGETKVTLQQIEVPEGYEATTDKYDIVVQNNAGEITYEIPGADINAERILVTFTNKTTGSENVGIPGKVVVQVKDQTGNPIQGSTIGLYMDGDKLPKSFPATDANGQIVIDDLQGLLDRYGSMLPEGETKVTLQQIEVPEGYEATTDKYDIVVKNNAGEITYEVPGADINAERILVTFTNKAIQSDSPVTEKGMLHIVVDLSNKPSTLVVDKATISIKNSAGTVVEKPELTAAVDWQVTVVDLPVGDYTIVQSIKVNDYTVTPTYLPQQKITITANQTAECTITNQFTKKASNNTNSGTSSSKKDSLIGIRTLDTSGAPLAGAKYALYHGATAIRSYTDYGTGQINIKDLDMLLGSYVGDLSIMDTPLTLQQTQPPLGGTRSTTTYDVYISSSGKVNVKGSEIDPNGVQLVDFIHEVKKENQPTTPTTPTNNVEEKDPGVIVVRTVDETGNVLMGAQYCLSTDLRYDADKDIVYSNADRHEEITIDDLEEHVEKGKKATYYLLQSRQPENGDLSAERFVVTLNRKKGNLEVEVKKDAGILERQKGGSVEESTTGEWIVTFCSSAKTTNIQIQCEEVVNWNDGLEVQDILNQYQKDEYEFQLNWKYGGEEMEPLSLKLANGQTGSFEPIPFGAEYEIVPVQDGCYKLEFTKGEQKGVATKVNMDLAATATYNIEQGKAFTIDMLKIDSRTERPVAGVVYILKNSANEEIDVYKTDSSGKLLIDAIMEPGEYLLSESEVPEGYNKLKKDIGISVSVGIQETQNEKGDPMILQTMEAVINHSQVRKQADGVFRIGTPQSNEAGKLPVILGVIGVVVASAAGAGVAMLQNKKKRRNRT